MRLWLQALLISVLLANPIFAYAAEKGLFWKVQSPTGVTSYLFGTMHADDERIIQFSHNVLKALGETDVFMMEVAEVNDPSLMVVKNLNLAQYLSEAELEQLSVLAEFHSLDVEFAVHMKPWLLAIVFELHKPQTPFVQDFLLQSIARDMGKPAEGIEQAKAHFSAMDSVSLDEQMLMLKVALKRSMADKMKDYEHLISAYLSADAERILRLDEEFTSDMLPSDLRARVRIALLDNRNVIMAERTIAKASTTPAFIAVGAAHLAGESGLLQAFKKAGFKLTALQQFAH